jgi:hypothetical protein
MMEALFGSPSPMWTTPLASGFVKLSPIQQPNPNAVPAAPYPSYPTLYPILANPQALTSTDIAAGVTAAALLAAVALRRGQPQGPSNDQEVEDFIYEALELLPGTSDVEVRCDSGRTTLAGVVHHKRIKHDVGEVAWAIPGLLDVQNNVTISSRRRARAASGRELEVPANQNRK